MKFQPKTTKLNGLLTLMVFALFALCILLVLLAGARVYRSQTEQGLEAYSRRTAAQYLSTRVRQGDRAGGVSVEPFGDGQALVFTEEIGGERLCTRVYCRDGWLWELFTPADAQPAPEDGQRLLPVKDLSFSLEHSCLTAQLTDETGGQQELLWYLRAGEGDTP